jgi:hypothetical protein
MTTKNISKVENPKVGIILNRYELKLHSPDKCEPEQLSRYTGQATGLSIEKSSFDSRQGQDNSLSSTTNRPALGLIQLPIQWVLWSLSKAPGREVDR